MEFLVVLGESVHLSYSYNNTVGSEVEKYKLTVLEILHVIVVKLYAFYRCLSIKRQTKSNFHKVI